jgi:hypothetical protein
MSSSTVDSILASYKYSYSAEIGKCRDKRTYWKTVAAMTPRIMVMTLCTRNQYPAVAS